MSRRASRRHWTITALHSIHSLDGRRSPIALHGCFARTIGAQRPARRRRGRQPSRALWKPLPWAERVLRTSPRAPSTRPPPRCCAKYRRESRFHEGGMNVVSALSSEVWLYGSERIDVVQDRGLPQYHFADES